ncbi:A/G-specific adenine glycosylase [Saccharibacillus brassicae]|uniref:Adenine DNA glycosylase n=1 Tax=Saccharibacillus brassicae TaxID=2583377 RepID=A0A4Y6V1R6_SACBS|nr:A/G-specific adenine glycosylase [Saccharibacillus brassicae]QDH22195.1 A/G-specific adenine glycosylase [Saccharibacillus brassicae]
MKLWFERNHRDYPWCHTKDPYEILIAEFLLQQTHVRKVEEAYLSLLSDFPTAKELAEASESKLIDLISPIGLIYRAKRMKSTANQVFLNYGGKIPDTFEDLIKLPGVGNYIANAVLCYGYYQNRVPIDTNVIRLFMRYFNLSSEKPRPRTDEVLAEQIRDRYTFDFDYRIANWAVLDFAGLVCTMIKPQCPLNEHCSYYNKKILIHKE